MYSLAPLVAAGTTPLVILNLVLGGACAVCVLIVIVAAYLDVRERRRWKSMVPPCWPPPGVDPRDAYVDLEAAPPTSAEPRASSGRGRVQ